MKTRERILLASLNLFNEHGEPNVTTLQIADELEISPGNLYYHYKNKSEIIVELFGRFENEINDLLDVSIKDEFSIDDYWLFLHLIFECIARYRFIYKDLVHLLQRYGKVQYKFKKVLHKKNQTCQKICQQLKRQGFMKVTEDELAALSQNIVLTITYWPSFDMLSHLASDSDIDLAKGVYQVMSMIAPHLEGDGRAMILEMSKQYLP